MFHLFNRVYLDFDGHINSKYEFIVFGKHPKPHPISRIIGKDVGAIPSFENELNTKFNGNIEVFWKFLLDKDARKKFFVFVDETLFFQLQIQYWKSIFLNPSDELLFKIYNFYKSDYTLKLMVPIDRGDNRFTSNSNLYQNLSFEEFKTAIAGIYPVKVLQISNKNTVSLEYLLADYLADENSRYVESLKTRVLDLAWKNWCIDVADLKAELITGFLNIHQLFPEIKADFGDDLDVISVLKSYPQLSWIMDSNITPDKSNYIVRTYDQEFFPKIQNIIDKVTQVGARVKGIPLDDIDIFNQASRTKELYNNDFKAIIENDLNRSFGSFFLHGDLFPKVNHILINYIYRAANLKDTAKLKAFTLA